jgi:hypothetical protein
MEQVEGGDLIVNRGDESRPKESADTPRDLGAVEGFEAASKLAKVTPNPISLRVCSNSASRPTWTS